MTYEKKSISKKQKAILPKQIDILKNISSQEW